MGLPGEEARNAAAGGLQRAVRLRAHRVSQAIEQLERPSFAALWVPGRPAPQGSKAHGEHGQLLEASKYLPAWRAAVKKAAYRWMREHGIGPADRPAMPGRVGFLGNYYFTPEQGSADDPPDLDKILRATWDALTQARVWEDDCRVRKCITEKWSHDEGMTPEPLLTDRHQGGAYVYIWRM